MAIWMWIILTISWCSFRSHLKCAEGRLVFHVLREQQLCCCQVARYPIWPTKLILWPGNHCQSSSLTSQEWVEPNLCTLPEDLWPADYSSLLSSSLCQTVQSVKWHHPCFVEGRLSQTMHTLHWSRRCVECEWAFSMFLYPDNETHWSCSAAAFACSPLLRCTPHEA